MKRIFLAGAALLAMAGAAQAADAYANFYGNTVTITTADGAKTVTYVNQDMTFEQHSPNGTVVKGTYSWQDPTTACFVATDPAPKGNPQPLCLKNQMSHNVGDTWTVDGMNGKPVTVSLTAGR